MTRRSLTLVVALACVSAIGAWSADVVPAAPPDTIRLGYATIAPEGTPWADQLIEIKQRIEKESGGRVKVALFLGGRLGSEKEMLADLRRGKIQGAGLSNGVIASEVPEFSVLELPFLFRSNAEADHVIDDVVGDELVAKAAEKGLTLAFWAENGWRSVATRKKAVRKPEDLSGMRVRAQEVESNVELWKALGAQPTQIPLNDVRSALETGVIDGFDQTPVYMVAAGWHTQIKFYTLTEHNYQPAVCVYNKRFIESLPDDLKKIVLADPHREALENRRRVRAVAEDVVKGLTDVKIEVIRLSDAEKEAFRARAEPVYKLSTGASSTELLQKVQKALEEYRAKNPPGG